MIDERYVRQTIFPGIGEEGQRKLLSSTVTLVGCGALGTVVAGHLARAGVGRLIIVDRDFVELSNLQRQTLFDEADVAAGLPKAVAAANKLRAANSGIKIEPLVMDLDYSNVEELIEDADVIVDGTDNFEARYVLNDAAVKLGKPWVHGAAVASYGLSATIVPHKSPCLRCLFPEPAPQGSVATCDTAGVLSPIVGVIGSIEAAEAIKLLVGRGDLNHGIISVDVWGNQFERLEIGAPLEACPCCGKGEYHFLQARAGSRSTKLCGRNAVQVTPASQADLSFDRLAKTLAPLGKVEFNDYLLRFSVGEQEMTVFPDGRAIIKGTDDEKLARSFYARYVGL